MSTDSLSPMELVNVSLSRRAFLTMNFSFGVSSTCAGRILHVQSEIMGSLTTKLRKEVLRLKFGNNS